MDLDLKSWKKQMLIDNNANIIDVRTTDEYRISHIPNSKNIDFYNPHNFIQEINKLDKNQSYYIYCRSGIRSANSCALMKELGFKKTFNLVGGIEEWNGKLIN